MTGSLAGREAMAQEIRALRERCENASREFREQYGADVDRLRTVVTEAVKDYTATFTTELASLSGGNRTCADLGEKVTSYLDWLQWTFWDLPHFALALSIPETRLRKAVQTCGMAYLSLRIFDDVVDRHFTYKGRHGTLFGAFERSRQTHQRAEGLTILAGLLVCFDGLSRLASRPGADEEDRAMLGSSLDALRRTVTGAILEMSPREDWDAAYYARLVNLKNVAFWQTLYSGLDPRHESPIYPFLERYYATAQKLNDAQDFADDERRGQPNLISLCLPREGEAVEGAFPPRAEEEVGGDLLDMGRMAEALPPLERLAALVKLGEALEEALHLGLFEPPPAPTDAIHAEASTGLDWYSTLDDVVLRLGAGVLEETNCAVCGSGARKRIFEKQGFSFHRCAECGHIYVSPRVGAHVSARMGRELDTRDFESQLLEVQKFYAAPICHVLRARAPGPRLLDIGFGRGYVLQLARSYGFEVYGIESSPRQYEALFPKFGDRLHLVTADGTGLPWEGFDAVVISHVLEHLERPQELLGQVFRAMNPDGVLYAAVPDIESVQFRVFGKKWEVISPLAHFQYFSEATLTRLLESCYFTDAERIDHQPVREEIAPRWMRLLRKLGASDAGELAMVCRRPGL
jgi:SAM-dependent methyltransferase